MLGYFSKWSVSYLDTVTYNGRTCMSTYVHYYDYM